MNDELKLQKDLIAKYAQKIAEETAKLQEDKQAEREERERRMESVRQKIKESESQVHEANDNIRSERDKIDTLGREIAAEERTQSQAKATMEDCSMAIDRTTEQMKSSLNAYGRNIESVVARIRAGQWRGQPPKGPLGMFVTLKDSTWLQPLQIMMGYSMFAYAITDSADRPALKRILHETGK